MLGAQTGQPQAIVESVQFSAALLAFQYFAGAAQSLPWNDIRDGIYGRTLVVREPVGVVGVITAWNVPLLLAATKLGPALLDDADLGETAARLAFSGLMNSGQVCVAQTRVLGPAVRL